MSRAQPASCRANAVISSDKMIDTRIEPVPIAGQSLDNAYHARREHIRRRCKNARQLSAQKPKTLTYSDATLEQEGADLIDDAGALADQSFAYSMQCLKIELVGRLCRHKLHGGALHRLGDRLSIAEIVLLPL